MAEDGIGGRPDDVRPHGTEGAGDGREPGDRPRHRRGAGRRRRFGRGLGADRRRRSRRRWPGIRAKGGTALPLVLDVTEVDRGAEGRRRRGGWARRPRHPRQQRRHRGDPPVARRRRGALGPDRRDQSQGRLLPARRRRRGTCGRRGGGSIVNLCSLTSYVGVPTAVPYGSSKTGLLGMTRALAAEWARARHPRQRHRARLFPHRHDRRLLPRRGLGSRRC